MNNFNPIQSLNKNKLNDHENYVLWINPIYGKIVNLSIAKYSSYTAPPVTYSRSDKCNY